MAESPAQDFNLASMYSWLPFVHEIIQNNAADCNKLTLIIYRVRSTVLGTQLEVTR